MSECSSGDKLTSGAASLGSASSVQLYTVLHLVQGCLTGNQLPRAPSNPDFSWYFSLFRQENQICSCTHLQGSVWYAPAAQLMRVSWSSRWGSSCPFCACTSFQISLLMCVFHQEPVKKLWSLNCVCVPACSIFFAGEVSSFACSSGPIWCPELLPTVWGCPPAGSRFNESQLEQQEPVKKLPHPPHTLKCTLCFTPRPPGYQSISCAAIMSEMYESMAWVWWNSCFVQIL